MDVESNKDALRKAMDDAGVTDPHMRAGIAAIAGGETGWIEGTEQGYGHTSNTRIRSIFGRTGAMTDAVLNGLKADDAAFFSLVYGGRYGNRVGTDDGFTYRGRGPFQLTFKDNYALYGGKVGADLVANPDLAADPVVGSQIAVAYILDRYEGGEGADFDFAAMQRAVGVVVNATAAALYRQYLDTGEFA